MRRLKSRKQPTGAPAALAATSYGGLPTFFLCRAGRFREGDNEASREVLHRCIDLYERPGAVPAGVKLRQSGIIAHYEKERGYGLIEVADGSRALFHHTDILGGSMLNAGDPVSLDVVEGLQTIERSCSSWDVSEDCATG